jgi:hypothetical protein
MMALDSSKLSVQEGLIQVVSAERFQSKPQAGDNVTVIIMKKSGNVLHYYDTLKSGQGRLSIGEQIWGNFVCYVIDNGIRKLIIEGDFATSDKITNMHVKAVISYQVNDPKLVAIGVDDALLSFKEELTTAIKRNIARQTIERIFESQLENTILQQDQQIKSLFGIGIIKASVNLEWDKEIINGLRDDRNLRIKQDRENKEKIRNRQLELDDIGHVDQVLLKLGLNSLPADARLKLLSMPREKAYQAIGEYIQDQRNLMQQNFLERAKQEYALLQNLIERGVLEDFDLQDFGKTLLDRYSHMVAMEDAFGVSPSLMLGGSQNKSLGGGDKKKEEKKKGKQEISDDENDE